jgi:hypothetical protein
VAIAVVGVTCSAVGGLTVRVAVRLWVPWPVSEFVKLRATIYVLAARPFAFELTVKVTVDPTVDTLPEVEDGLSQFGTLVIV